MTDKKIIVVILSMFITSNCFSQAIKKVTLTAESYNNVFSSSNGQSMELNLLTSFKIANDSALIIDPAATTIWLITKTEFKKDSLNKEDQIICDVKTSYPVHGKISSFTGKITIKPERKIIMADLNAWDGRFFVKYELDKLAIEK